MLPERTVSFKCHPIHMSLWIFNERTKKKEKAISLRRSRSLNCISPSPFECRLQKLFIKIICKNSCTTVKIIW